MGLPNFQIFKMKHICSFWTIDYMEKNWKPLLNARKLIEELKNIYMDIK